MAINAKDKAGDGINSLKTMIAGLFCKDRIIDIIHNFIYFPDTSKDERKYICRYPQFFAARSLYQHGHKLQNIIKLKETSSTSDFTSLITFFNQQSQDYISYLVS